MWGELQRFSSGLKAFSPVITVLPSRALVLGFRDKDLGGAGYLVGGVLSADGLQVMRFSKLQTWAGWLAGRQCLKC